MTHTPGPWHIEFGTGGHDQAHRILGPNDEYVVDFEDLDPERPSMANAYLIAAAPDLLRQLAHLVRLIEPLERDGSLNIPGLATLNGARAALAKASGS